MLCPVCKTEMRIRAVHTEVTGDETAAVPTRVYTVQSLACRNRRCTAFDTDARQVRTLLYDGAAAAESAQKEPAAEAENAL